MRTLRRLATLGLATAAAACTSGTNGTAPEAAGRVALNLSTNAATAASMASGATSTTETYIMGTDTLVIDKVELVLREIELELASGSVGCTSDDDDDECSELELATRLFDLPLGSSSGASRAITVDVPAGSYDEVEFEVHKPSRSDDAAFLAANPDFDGVAVRVSGTWNGQRFTFTSDVEAEYELEFSPPLQVTESGNRDFTINIDVGSWFRASGGALIDPRTATRGQPNESRVRNNIQNSVDAFDDDDRDGYDDD